MTQVVHLRIKAAEASSRTDYTVETALIGESGVERRRPQTLELPRALTDPDGPQALWERVRELVADEPGLWVLRLHGPELRRLDWEGMAENTAPGKDGAAPRVLRTAVGPRAFQPGEQPSFGDLPVRVLVVGVNSHLEPHTVDDPPWHEDVAVYDAVYRPDEQNAVSADAQRWEVEVLPMPVSHHVLAETVKASKPHVLHLAGDSARALFEEGVPDVNLASVRLVVSSSGMDRAEAHELLEPFAQADAVKPVRAVVSLTPGPKPDTDHALCTSLAEFYRSLIAGEGLDEAARSAREADPSASVTVTVNCCPDAVLPRSSASSRSSASDVYQPLERATDRVGQRRTALEQLESGAAVRPLIVVSGGEPDDRIGSTWFLLSTLRVWEERPGARALYLDFGRLGRTKPPRSADDMPQADDTVLETVALIADSVRAHSDRHGGWGLDDDLVAVDRLVQRHRDDVARDGGIRTGVSPIRDRLVRAAVELLVRAAPPDTHLVLALDHFLDSGKVPYRDARSLVSDVFKPALHGPGAITVMATAKRPRHDQTEDLLLAFAAEPHEITLQRWSPHHGWPLLRELGTRMGYKWHDKPGWRALVREKLHTVEEDFGPQLLQEVCDIALTRLG
ncbi:hypothetical protein Stsp02_33110 [Streptomyces sp. NBRC 14336]|uniref:hypothetical protein n=1 Tax=Streptomyces sp. NBRC 14336 TaxID=3030992 RepID=UPI0024A50C02|nr:hypothetical protein [Streptomyces sp. NBRC 14336]GLW47649.1 hypothetical protein Stsp02_33110 [Streptomyces sp. NBRC 14336]